MFPSDDSVIRMLGALESGATAPIAAARPRGPGVNRQPSSPTVCR
jgi:hypothetical protein